MLHGVLVVVSIKSSTSKTSGSNVIPSIQKLLVFKLLAHPLFLRRHPYLLAFAGRPRFLGWDPSLPLQHHGYTNYSHIILIER